MGGGGVGERGGGEGGSEGRVWHLAVLAVRGVLIACSIVVGRVPCVPGRINPDRGRPAWEIGLSVRWWQANLTKRKIRHHLGHSVSTRMEFVVQLSYLTPWLVPVPAVPGGFRSDVPGPINNTKNNQVMS